MRLIDADKLKEEMKVNGLGYQYYMLDNAPTVKAIPIEWIKKWLETCIPHYDYDRMTYIADVYDMLEDWDEENGRSK